MTIQRSRQLLGAELSALVGESYERAYGDMVRVQQLTELEEVVRYQQNFAGALLLLLLAFKKYLDLRTLQAPETI